MTEDALAFLDQKGMTETPAPEPVQADPAPEPIQPEGEPATPPVAQAEEPRHIPITALLDEREKRQAKEREAEELRRKLAEYEARQQPVAPPPDVFTDPDQRFSYERQQVQGAIIGVKMQQSRFLAERDFSPEEVNAAVEWFNDYPELSHKMINHPSPFHAAVETYRRFKAAEKVGPDPDAFINAEVERRLAERLAAAAPAQVQPPRPAAPASLATAPAVGRATSQPQSPGSIFDATFKR